jgi:protein-tyrosine phosphatase
MRETSGTVALAEPPQRAHMFDGPANFRDLGGYRARGDRLVRWGELFRSDSLDTATRCDVDRLKSQLRLSTVVDLRSDDEVTLVSPLFGAALTVRSIPLNDGTGQLAEPDARSLASAYVTVLDGSARRFVEIVTAIAELPTPIVFHGSLGKDRTGLLAAILLDLLGVSDEDIADDYALSAAVMTTLQQRAEYAAAASGRRLPTSPRMNAELFSARRSTIDIAMTILRAQHNSIEGWLRCNGLRPAVADQLRQRFTEAT